MPVFKGYRPHWSVDGYETSHTAAISFDHVRQVNPGETIECYLQPLTPELWLHVIAGTQLKCYEGTRQVGYAEVIEVLE